MNPRQGKKAGYNRNLQPQSHPSLHQKLTDLIQSHQNQQHRQKQSPSHSSSLQLRIPADTTLAQRSHKVACSLLRPTDSQCLQHRSHFDPSAGNTVTSTIIIQKMYVINYYYHYEHLYHFVPHPYNWIKQFIRFTDTGHIVSFLYYFNPKMLPLAHNVHFIITFAYWISNFF